MYKEKYLKYKTKYLYLKSQLGGGDNLLHKKTTEPLYLNDDPYSFITHTFDDENDKLTISYEDNESDYHLLIYFNKTFNQKIIGNEIEFKYGKKGTEATVVSIEDEPAINKLPYIVAFILFILIQSIMEIPENIENSSNWISKLNLLKKNILDKIKSSVKITYDNSTKQLTITAIKPNIMQENIIILNFNDKKIYYSNRLENRILTEEGLTDEQVLSKQFLISKNNSYRYDILINISIWLLELDNKIRMIFAINMNFIISPNKLWSIEDFKDENLVGHKEALLNLLKQYTTQMKERLLY
jgi:hypothetical protein